jgi:hypothetical protein
MIKRELLEAIDRALTEREQLLLSHALVRDSAPQEFRDQVARTRVRAQSRSTWPILEFRVDSSARSAVPDSLVVAQLQYIYSGTTFMLSVYQESGYLAGMVCWSIAGDNEPHSWPNPHELLPHTNPDA